MSEFHEFDLPYGVSVDDLVYLRLLPEDESDFERQAIKNGWDTYILKKIAPKKAMSHFICLPGLYHPVLMMLWSSNSRIKSVLSTITGRLSMVMSCGYSIRATSQGASLTRRFLM